MDIGINSNIHIQNAKQHTDNIQPQDHTSGVSFLGVAKKVFSVFAPVPAQDADKSAAAHFKKIKETSKIDKKRTEEDALRDIEKLLRRVEKNKKLGKHAGSR